MNVFKNKTTRFLTASLVAVVLLCVCVFSFLAFHMSQVSTQTINQVGTLYMSNMSQQISMHFATTISLRLDQLDALVTSIPPDGSNAGIKVGEELTVDSLLYCIMLSSANEGCNILAEAVSGSIDGFVEQMNQKAAALGCTDTHFVNTNGLPDSNHYTTAWDLYLITKEARTHPDFMPLVGTIFYEVPATNLSDPRKLYTTNYLISSYRTSGYIYKGAEGIKTGSTPEAGYCLASAAEKNGRTMIAVVLGGVNWRANGEYVEHNYFIESKALLEHGFNDFSRKTVLSQIEPIDTIPVKLCAQQDYVTVQASQGLEATLPNDLDPALFQRRIELPEDLEAPIEKGQVLGTISISYEGKDYGSADLIATTALERSQLVFILDNLQALFSRLWVKILLLVVILLLLLLVMRRMVFGPSRRKRYNTPRTYSSSYRGRKR